MAAKPVRTDQMQVELQPEDGAAIAPRTSSAEPIQELVPDKCEPWIGWLESCRKYLLLVANREMGNDLKSKEGP